MTSLLRRPLLALLLVVPALAAAGCGEKASKQGAANAVLPTTTTTAYPGDGASRVALARWMGAGAAAAGLPRELPVMGALVESGLANVRSGDSDSAGFFQIPVRIWNKGAYAGFPDKPELQLKWFVDQALAFGRRRAAAGIDTKNDQTWGAWVADVERPAAQFRGRYQLRLTEARKLLGG
jgi:hypothetical protein